MNLLWQKDSKSPGLYVDVFKDVSYKDYDFHSNLKTVSEATAKLAALKIKEKNDTESAYYRKMGYKKFQEEEWLDAMSLFNQSLCYAEIGSVNVSLAYANRSACFFHLKMYDKCLVDIDLAKQANPTNLMPELDELREDCLKLMRNCENSDKLSYEADKRFPGMAKVLEIRCDKKFGRHIIAKTDLPAGKTILVEKPFVARLLNTYYNGCSVCMNISMNFIACAQCTTALFCNSECANANEMHNLDCAENWQYSEPPLEYYTGAIFFIMSVLPNVENLIEFVQEAIKKQGKIAPHSLGDVKSKLRALLQLSTHSCPSVEKNREYLREAYITYNSLLLRKSIKKLFETEQKKRFLMHLVLHIKCVITNNGFNSDERMSLYIISSYFNHACTPNVIGMYTDENVRFCRTTRPIKAGQQLFITYLGDVYCEESVEYCQTFLYRNFGFQCKCERCQPNKKSWAMNSYNMELDQDYQLLTTKYKYDKFMNDGVGTKEEKKAILEEKIVDLLNRFGDKHWCDELAAIIEYYENFQGLETLEMYNNGRNIPYTSYVFSIFLIFVLFRYYFG